MTSRSVLAAFSPLLAAGSSFAMVVNFTPDGSSRFIDHFSNAYAQLDLDTDGMYNLSTDALINPVDGFATDWSNIGSLIIDGTETPDVTGTFDIIGTSGFDINSFVSGPSFSVLPGFGSSGVYTTLIDNIDPSSEVEFTNGNVDSLLFLADITFTFQVPSPFPPPDFLPFPYSGTIQITESSFSILVDDGVQPSPASPVIRQEWSLTGSSSAVAVPEPSVAALWLSICAVLFLSFRRRRQANR